VLGVDLFGEGIWDILSIDWVLDVRSTAGVAFEVAERCRNEGSSLAFSCMDGTSGTWHGVKRGSLFLFSRALSSGCSIPFGFGAHYAA